MALGSLLISSSCDWARVCVWYWGERQRGGGAWILRRVCLSSSSAGTPWPPPLVRSTATRSRAESQWERAPGLSKEAASSEVHVLEK